MNPFLLLALLITPTATPSASIPTPTPGNLEEIQKIRQVVQEKVKEKIKEITQTTPTKRGVIGVIKDHQGNTITLDHQNITYDENTVIIDIKRNKALPETLKIGQEILVLGYNSQEDPQILEAKRIVFSNLSTIQSQQQIIAGQIIDVSQSLPVFTLIPNTDKDSQLQVKLDSKVKIFDRNSNELKNQTLAPNTKIIVVYQPDPKNPKTITPTRITIFNPPVPTPTPEAPEPTAN